MVMEENKLKEALQFVEQANQHVGQHPLAQSDAAMGKVMNLLYEAKKRLMSFLGEHEKAQPDKEPDQTPEQSEQAPDQTPGQSEQAPDKASDKATEQQPGDNSAADLNQAQMNDLQKEHPDAYSAEDGKDPPEEPEEPDDSEVGDDTNQPDDPNQSGDDQSTTRRGRGRPRLNKTE
jgi:hypothetical protein